MATQKWTLGELMKTFGLKRLIWGLDAMPLLENWVNVSQTFSESEEASLEKLRLKLLKQADNWDEEDLKMYFIAFLLDMAGYLEEDKPYHAFFEKTISVTLPNYTLTSKPDMLLAEGLEDTWFAPYFCFHEYKRAESDKTARAQVLLDMFIAQQLNQNEKPIYGAYVSGKSWNFVVLKGKEFMISQTFDATQKIQLQQILGILRAFWGVLGQLQSQEKA